MNKTIPYLDFAGMHSPIREELKKAMEGVLDSNWFILGKKVESFEKSFADYCGLKYGIGVNSGLDAIVLAFKSIGLKPGDEVLVASNAYIACWNAIHQVGATITPVEPDPITNNISINGIKNAINKNTKAILAVHLYGRMCDMESIIEIAKAHKLWVIEDNAQAQGAEQNGKHSGGWGHINATSFYPGKNLGALGDGGIITTDHESWAKYAASMRNYGSEKKYHNEYIGINSRLDELQAAILSVKLKYLDQWNIARINIAQMYHERLGDIEELILPELLSDRTHVYHIFAIKTAYRNELQQYLKDEGIGTMIHYPIPPHLQKAYHYLGYKKGDFPIAERGSETMLSLPIYPGLKEEEVEYISERIRKFMKQKDNK